MLVKIKPEIGICCTSNRRYCGVDCPFLMFFDDEDKNRCSLFHKKLRTLHGFCIRCRECLESEEVR